ncbi:MAG: bifunctional serine/threonine-protein kinase/formylglycine-generating enzyme family protein [Chloroflexota bacterium]
MPLTPGQILDNRYRVVKLLGQGGFGAVYRVWDTRMERPMALKENLDISPEAQRQFKREAQILFDLSHPNLPRVIDNFVIQGQGQYLVMDYVEGEDLQEMLQRVGGPLPEEQVLEWIGQVCDALIYLHSQNPPIIHRDIKPANIKITPQGKAMLVDFGIAKVYDPRLSTTAGAKAVTPGYSPHEQYGTGTTDARTDVYALGATLYHLLTGVQPVESIQRMVRDPLTPLQQLKPDIAVQIAEAVQKALAMDPEQRFQSVTAFKQALSGNEGTGSQFHTARVSSGPLRTQLVPSQPEVQQAATGISPIGKLRDLPWSWIGTAVVLLVVVMLLGNWLGGKVGRSEATATHTIMAQLTQFSSPATSAPIIHTETPSSPTVTPPANLGMVLIPEGEFKMGSDDERDSAAPVHTVFLDAYYIDVYEVTNAKFADFLNEMGNLRTDGIIWLDADDKDVRIYQNDGLWKAVPGYDDHPVVATWPGASAYCEWRGARLPTEAEWEKAARGGLEGAVFPWGDDEPVCIKGSYNGAKINDFSGCADTGTASVGSFDPNGYGLFDMAGNAWEWVWDWDKDDYYAESPFANPTGPTEPNLTSHRVRRGGSWDDASSHARVANRSAQSTFLPNGFRCVRSVEAIEGLLLTETAATAELPTPVQVETLLPPTLIPELRTTMVLIPAGEFEMGSTDSDPNAYSEEKPQHTVFLDAYYIDPYEVTNSRFAVFLSARGNQSEDGMTWLDAESPDVHIHQNGGGWQVDSGYDSHPVVMVSWYGAQAYCEWRGGSLPTEAQWEKAARGGLEGKLYPWGDDEPQCQKRSRNGAKFDDDAGCDDTGPEPVGSYAPNGFGLYDMVGNVNEWIWDWYSQTFYSSSPSRNPTGPESGDFRMLRGGGWSSQSSNLRVALRNIGGGRLNSVGFRCILPFD